VRTERRQAAPQPSKGSRPGPTEPVRRDRNNPLPLYHQLAASIRQQIRDGTLRPGTQLASEADLSRQAGVSRMTVRQAIGLLVAEGLLVVRHGVGTFVAEPRLTYDALHLLGFSETLALQGGTTTSDVLEQRLVEPPRLVANELGLGDAAGGRVVKVSRLRRGHSEANVGREGGTFAKSTPGVGRPGEPLLLETSYVPAALCPGLENVDLTGRSLYATLENDFGLRLASARQHFSARSASAFEQRCLQLAPGSCVMALRGVTADHEGRPVEYFEAVYRADRFEFVVTSSRNAAQATMTAVSTSVETAP